MTNGQEEIKGRLDNIYSIEPLLAALRTISLSNWKYTLKKINWIRVYQDQLLDVYHQLKSAYGEKKGTEIEGYSTLIALGSNRGLCSNFNRDIVSALQNFKKETTKSKPDFIVIGERLKKMLDRKKISYSSYIQFPTSGDLTPAFLGDHFGNAMNPHQFENVSVIYNHYLGAAQYHTRLKNIFPFEPDHIPQNKLFLEDYILDTPPGEIFDYLEKQLSLLSLYDSFLSSAAAEHSTRFQLMENASNNANRLAEELNIEVQVLRRQKITSEMRELAIGAGLLKKSDTRKPSIGSQNY